MLWSDDRIIETIHVLALRDNSPRINLDDAIDKMIAIRDDYEVELASLRQQLVDSVPRSEVNAMIDNNRVSDAVTIDSLSHEIAQLKQQLAEAQAWEVVPSSLEYDLITYAILNGKIPVEYHIMRHRTQGGEK